MTSEVSLHPFASVISTLYVPAHNVKALKLLGVLGALYQSYKYPPSPPDAVTSASPKQTFLHKTCTVSVIRPPTAAEGSVISALAESTQPFASVISTLYVPAHKSLIVGVVGDDVG